MKSLVKLLAQTAPQQWDKRPEQQSRWVTLNAGQRYCLEVLMKQGGGGECLAVAWEGPRMSQQVIQKGYTWRRSQPVIDEVLAPDRERKGICELSRGAVRSDVEFVRLPRFFN